MKDQENKWIRHAGDQQTNNTTSKVAEIVIASLLVALAVGGFVM
jgi:hypothetical protein